MQLQGKKAYEKVGVEEKGVFGRKQWSGSGNTAEGQGCSGNSEITLLGFRSSIMNCLNLSMLCNTSVPKESSSHKMGLLKYPPHRVIVIYSISKCFKNT